VIDLIASCARTSAKGNAPKVRRGNDFPRSRGLLYSNPRYYTNFKKMSARADRLRAVWTRGGHFGEDAAEVIDELERKFAPADLQVSQVEGD
jgi:hypothetical protein